MSRDCGAWCFPAFFVRMQMNAADSLSSEFVVTHLTLVTSAIQRNRKNKMNYTLDPKYKKLACVRRLFEAALMLGFAFGTISSAAAQRVTPPATPSDITPPAGNTLFCWATLWVLRAMCAFPKAPALPGPSTRSPRSHTLSTFSGQPVQLITHFLSPDTNPNECPKPAAIRKRNLAEFFRQQQGVGSGETRSPQVPTLAAPTLAQLPASCCRSIGS